MLKATCQVYHIAVVWLRCGEDVSNWGQVIVCQDGIKSPSPVVLNFFCTRSHL